jgi:streptomycin 6-kinase
VADTGLTHADWLARVPDLVAECAAKWGVRLGEPYPRGAAGFARRVELRDGTRAVLKLIYPDRESTHEAAALKLLDGDGAVRLLDQDPERWAMLLERCEPGTPLSAAGGEAALDVLVGLLPRTWKPAGEPFMPLADEAAWWCEYLPAQWERLGRRFERKLLDAAIALLRELAPTQGEQVLVQQDLHGDNVLAARREPWLMIDPKPLVGEREFAVAPIVRSGELGHGRTHAFRRLDRLTSELALDRERARGWTIGQTIAWAADNGGYIETHLETARWLLESA